MQFFAAGVVFCFRAVIWTEDSDVAAGSRPSRKARSDFETRYVATALARTGGKMAEAARLLGISRVALHKRIKKQAPR